MWLVLPSLQSRFERIKKTLHIVRVCLTAGALVVALGGGLFSCGRRSPDVSPPTPGPPPTPSPSVSTAPGPRAPDEGVASCGRDAEAEKIVAAELVGRVQPAQTRPRAHVRVTFGCLPGSPDGPLQIDGLRAHGHGGDAVLISLDLAQDGTCAVRAVRLTPDRAPRLAGPSPALAIARAHVPEARARQALSIMRAALTAHVEVDLPAAVPGERPVVSVKGTTHDEHLEITWRGPTSVVAASSWEGYVNSLEEEKRAPLDIAWKAITDLVPANGANEAPTREEVRLLARLWKSESRRGPWVKDALLGFAAVLGSAAAAPEAIAALDSPRERTRILAVNALATATGRDLRRTSDGKLRPLADVVTAYKGLKDLPAPNGP
jgi:hypothetical protein